MNAVIWCLIGMAFGLWLGLMQSKPPRGYKDVRKHRDKWWL